MRGRGGEQPARPLKGRCAADSQVGRVRTTEVQFRDQGVGSGNNNNKKVRGGEEQRKEIWPPEFRGSSLALPYALFSPL